MGQICSFLWTHKNKKAFSLREGKPLPPYPPPGTLPPEAPLGAPLPDPRYRLALRARHGIRTLCSSPSILTMAGSVAVCEIFSVREWRELETGLGFVQGH